MNSTFSQSCGVGVFKVVSDIVGKPPGKKLGWKHRGLGAFSPTLKVAGKVLMLRMILLSGAHSEHTVELKGGLDGHRLEDGFLGNLVAKSVSAHMRPFMPKCFADQSEARPPSERANRFIRPKTEAMVPEMAVVWPWYS